VAVIWPWSIFESSNCDIRDQHGLLCMTRRYFGRIWKKNFSILPYTIPRAIFFEIFFVRFWTILKRYSTQNLMLIPNMCVLGRSFLGRKHALMPLVLCLHFLFMWNNFFLWWKLPMMIVFHFNRLMSARTCYFVILWKEIKHMTENKSIELTQYVNKEL
jgi:hypothetical protein